MILPALVDYYERLAGDPGVDMPRYGWSRQKIGFVVVLNDDGSLHAIEPPPMVEAGAPKRLTLVVPGQSKPSGSGINPCFLWDNATYMLGVTPDGKSERWADVRFERFRDEHLARQEQVDSRSFAAVCSFLTSWSPRHLDAELIEKVQGFGVFRIRASRCYVHEEATVVRYWDRSVATSVGGTPRAVSLLSGEVEPVAVVHEPKLKGVRGGQTSGTVLASFNLGASESYHKEQGFNAPVGVHDAFRYCTALNRLLADPRRCLQVGKTTAVFWAEKPHPVEDITGCVLGGVEDEDTVRRLNVFLTAARSGRPDQSIEHARTRFFLLGLAPNHARVSLRFWWDGTVALFTRRVLRHAAALGIDGAPDGYALPSIRRIVAETAAPKNGWPDEERVSPLLAGEVARSVLAGLPYPRSLLNGVVGRIRAEGFANPEKRKDWRAAMHRRASIVKAYLVRAEPGQDKDVPMSLNESYPAPAYHLGRLFAILEKTQEEAFEGKPNASVRDRYLGTASVTPSIAFPRLLRLHGHHVRKIEHPGRRVNIERLVARVFERIEGFPPHLPIEGQGQFFLGYYQQRQDLYTTKKDADANAADA